MRKHASDRAVIWRQAGEDEAVRQVSVVGIGRMGWQVCRVACSCSIDRVAGACKWLSRAVCVVGVHEFHEILELVDGLCFSGEKRLLRSDDVRRLRDSVI